MAGNKMNTKTKSKEDKSKASSKAVGQTSEESEDTDFALLRKPILTSITGFGQARKIFDLATEELKDLLSKECDLLYECKVCRNIFRSLANFISHKRVYCKEKFNTSVHSHFINATSTVTEMLKIKSLEQGYQDSLKETIEIEAKETEDVDDRVPLTKDLTAIVEKIAQNRGVLENNKEQQIDLQKIPNSSVAVFQNVQENKPKESMKVQVKELDKILSRDVAVLQSDGNFKIQSSVSEEVDNDNVIQISDDEENGDNNNILKCKVCDMQFSTQKTLKFHMKYKHVESRLVYPCPDCLEIFSTSWSVYRHLFKVHRKTAAQIRRLRESIQAKAFKMNNPPAFYEKRKNNMKATAALKISEEERIEQENQAWMDNMEGDGELPRCGGCGRTFERRAALAAHTHTCQPRSRALSRRPQETKKIEIQIRKDYHKGPPVNLNLSAKTTDANENKISKEEPQIASKPNKEEEKEVVEEDNNVIEEDKDDDEDKDEEDDTLMDVSDDDTQSNDATETSEKEPEKRIEPPKFNIRLPFAHQAEKSNLTAFRQRIQSEIEVNKLLCKRCDAQFTETQELYDHAAEHVKWLRYACKLCNYKHYSFEKLPEHVKVVHKLKGDKDFYYSTVKAIDGTEALELCESTDELPDANETSPDSRRPSRCSSDSSRLSDDSSSSSTLEALGRKRKIHQSKPSGKRRKECIIRAEKGGDGAFEKNICLIENFTSIKNFEENSSDIDDIDAKKQLASDHSSSVASRRPVRRKTKPKNADFEYDLSNLLKMEAQGYRDSLTMASAKTTHSKKKIQEIQLNYDNVNKDCCGALITMSKKSIERAAAHIKTDFSSVYPQKDTRPPNIFVRPMLPKIISRGDKQSPKKDTNEDAKESPSPSPVKVKESPSPSPVKVKESPSPSPVKEVITPEKEEVPKVKDGDIFNTEDNSKTEDSSKVEVNSKPEIELIPEITSKPEVNITPEVTSKPEVNTKPEVNITPEVTSKPEVNTKPEVNLTPEVTSRPEVNTKPEINSKPEVNSKSEVVIQTESKAENSKTEVVENAASSKEQICFKGKLNEIIKPKSFPSVVPLKFRRQSLEVMKNPLINKNITDFTKSGLKTKILVIKPINRNKDGKQTLNSPLKFQTIKLKDPSKRCSKDDQDQVVVVKVPKVDCAISRPITDVSSKNIEQPAPATSIESTTPKDNENDTKPVENNVDRSTVTVPPILETSNEPTDFEECASNDIEDPKIITDESSIADNVAIMKDIIDEPVTDKDTSSETVNTTV